MPTIFDISYKTLGQQLLPPDKRNTRLTAFVICLLAPMQWLRDLWMGSYRVGSVAPTFDSGTTYDKYDQVVYNKIVYTSLQGGNIGKIPNTTAASTYWAVIQNNFIGLSERLVYNGETLVLTWALNKWFGTTFVQPNQRTVSSIFRTSNIVTATVTGHGYNTNDIIYIFGLSDNDFDGVYKITVVDTNTFAYANAGVGTIPLGESGTATKLSQIYIFNNTIPASVFVSGGIEDNSSDVFNNRSPDFVINSYSFAATNNFGIYIPTSILDVSVANNVNIFRAFAGQHIPAGITYNLINY